MKSETARLQFDLPAKRVDEIDALMELTGIATRKLLVEYALANFKWSIAQARDGRAIVAYDAGNNAYRELSMPPLDVVRGNGGVRTSSTGGHGAPSNPNSPASGAGTASTVNTPPPGLSSVVPA